MGPPKGSFFYNILKKTSHRSLLTAHLHEITIFSLILSTNKLYFWQKQSSMRVHFIAIGGSAMHNLAIALHKKGYQVTGSDDEIFEPSKTRLAKLGLLPSNEGWFVENIHQGLDAVILGMHAKADNPELLEAQKLGLKIYSYPEYLYEQSKDKTRVVIGGSHGKTTITAMILHVLKQCGVDCDFMVGAQLEGFDVMVRLSEEAPVMVFEGDEYLTSPIDRRPKFHLYKPDIALLSGIAWDHINVFPTFENYIEQFTTFIQLITPEGKLIYCLEDKELARICPVIRNDIHLFPYSALEYEVRNGITIVRNDGKDYPLQIFGYHNLLNLNGARMVCNQLGIVDDQFFEAISGFRGASRRLELIGKNDQTAVYKDFAHSPSKLEATIRAVKEQFPGRKLVACMELHTYSSLSREFLSHYRGCMDLADEAMIYFNPHAIRIKKLPELTPEQVRQGFSNEKLIVFTDSKLLSEHLLTEEWNNKNLIMMSSGDFDGIDFSELAGRIVN
jgi:UDP-N-acetylmuramate: L-alanyl-gamma-D-glutamyl-meso-diaminopimelate ligase